MRALISLFFVLVILAQPALAEAQRVITVTGSGTAEAVPDMAMIQMGVMFEDANPELALAQVSEAATAITERIKAMQIAPRDVQTSDLSLNPVWNNRSSSSGSEPRVSGYSASIQVRVRVRDLDKLGEIIAAVVSDGANRFGGLQFGLQYPDPVLEAARRNAVKDGKARASLYAQAAGVKLGKLLSITEPGTASGPGQMMMEMASMGRAADVPVSAGELSLSAQVTMVFEIED